MSHNFLGDICTDCGKTIEELFFELLIEGNERALEYNYHIATGGYFSEISRREIVISQHEHCLTPDERMIKDLIE